VQKLYRVSCLSIANSAHANNPKSGALAARAPVVIEPLSSARLLKTGIFAAKAADFRRFRPEVRQGRSPEPKASTKKTGPFSRFLGSLAKCWNGCLGRQASNYRISVLGKFEMAKKKTIKKTDELSPIYQNALDSLRIGEEFFLNEDGYSSRKHAI
jgi:hypothetical protein